MINISPNLTLSLHPHMELKWAEQVRSIFWNCRFHDRRKFIKNQQMSLNSMKLNAINCTRKTIWHRNPTKYHLHSVAFGFSIQFVDAHSVRWSSFPQCERHLNCCLFAFVTIVKKHTNYGSKINEKCAEIVMLYACGSNSIWCMYCWKSKIPRAKIDITCNQKLKIEGKKSNRISFAGNVVLAALIHLCTYAHMCVCT